MANSGDVFFPHYVTHFLPAGIPGLILAGLLAAAMSSLSSGINSTITVIAKDFIDPFRTGTKRSEANQIKTARFLASGIGIITISGSQAAGAIPGNLLEVVGRTVNLFVCPLFGLFFLALFIRFATPFGAIVGAIYSMFGAALIGYWDVFTGGAPISFQWIAPVALTITLVCGPFFSLWPTRGKSIKAMAVYYLITAIPLITVISIIR